MSDAKENEEAGQGVPSAVEERQLVDARVQLQPEASSSPFPIKETSHHVENGKAEPPGEDESVKPGKSEPPAEDESVKPVKAEPPVEDKSVKSGKAEPPVEDKSVKPGKAEPPAEDNSVKPGKTELRDEDNSVKPRKADAPAEDNSVKPEAVSEGIPQPDVQNTLHPAPVEADGQILNRAECEEASGAKTEAEEFPLSNKGIDNDNNACRNNVDAAEVKPEACEVADTKTCDKDGPVPSSHNEPTTLLAIPADKKAEIKNELEVENKANEKQAAEPADNGNSNSKHMCFLDADHSYDGNESGTEEEQSAFMKELENFFRERSMEFKPPKFYGEGLNCLK